MKRKAFLVLTSLGFSLLLLNGCEPATVSNSPAPNANAPAEAVDTASIESDILKIENDWPRIFREKDGAAVRRIEAEDAILVYPDGSVGDREQDARDTEAGNLTADAIEMADIKVKVLDRDAAVATGRIIMTNAKMKTPDGKTVDISGQYRFVDTFARRNGQWKLEAGISTRFNPIAGSPTPGASLSPRTTPAASASPAARPSPVTRPSPPARTTPATNPTP